MINLGYHYFFIRKIDGMCFQYNNADVPDYSFNDDTMFSIQMDGLYNVGGNYLLKPDLTPAQSADDEAYWYRKVWNELDKNGIPVDASGFTWEAFTPELVAE